MVSGAVDCQRAKGEAHSPERRRSTRAVPASQAVQKHTLTSRHPLPAEVDESVQVFNPWNATPIMSIDRRTAQMRQYLGTFRYIHLQSKCTT